MGPGCGGKGRGRGLVGLGCRVGVDNGVSASSVPARGAGVDAWRVAVGELVASVGRCVRAKTMEREMGGVVELLGALGRDAGGLALASGDDGAGAIGGAAAREGALEAGVEAEVEGEDVGAGGRGWVLGGGAGLVPTGDAFDDGDEDDDDDVFVFDDDDEDDDEVEDEFEDDDEDDDDDFDVDDDDDDL